jgi:DNA-binding MarR family transcriptional regulator
MRFRAVAWTASCLGAKHIAVMTGVLDLLALWERVTNRLVFLEKRYAFHHGDLVLHPSEIHLLLAISREPMANATGLAGRLGITKGAVSQILKKLEGKGIVTKHVDPSQKNEVTMTFTKRGQQALDTFAAERHSALKPFNHYLAALTPKERATINAFLEHAEAILPEPR